MSSPPDPDRSRQDLAWRVLVDGPLSGAANMARDHAIAAALPPGTGTVRFYGWSPATLSLGRNEPVTVEYRGFLRRRPEIGVVRRPTGGRAVIHDRELTYSVAMPARAFGGPRGAYRKVNEGLVKGLRGLGVDARAAGGRVLSPDAGPCFLEPAGGEVVVGGRKLVGSAQARIGGAVLQHGSVLLVADQSPLLDGRGRRNGDGSPGPITLAQLLAEVPSLDRLVAAFRAGFEHALGGSWRRGTLTGSEETLAAGLENRYASADWTWRR